MAILKGIAVCCLIGLTAAQYGPPKQTGPVKHRTTTTTQTPPSANEIFPESGDSVYQPSPGYQPQPQPGQQPIPGYPNQPSPQPGYNNQPSQQPLPSPDFPVKSNYQPSAPPPPPGSVPSKPVDISNNPFINAGISGKPVSSGSYQPQQPNQPSPQPGYPKPGGYPSPTQPGQQPGYPNPSQPQPSPSAPGYPVQQPAPPAQPGFPAPQPGAPSKPINIQGNPFLSGAVKPQQPPTPGYPQQQPIPQPPPFKPQPQQPYQPNQPGQQPRPDESAYKPAQLNPPSYQPGRPGQPNQPPFRPQQPYQPGQQLNQPGQPGQQPYQPGQPGLPSPQPGYPKPPSPYQPGQPGQPGQQPYQPGQPGQQPYQPGQPGQQPYQPGQPGQQPGQPGQQPYQPGQPGQQPYNPSQPGQPAAPSCYGPGIYCVPSTSCYNGVITGNNNPAASFKSGQCSPGQVCCKAPQPSAYTPAYVTEAPVAKYTGPLNTAPPTECAAALKCVPESYCDEKGVMRDGPVALTREQQENKVPLSGCLNTETGVYGKCCRDPNYKDPWPAGMMMPKTDDGQGFDDGQYKPGQYPGENGQPGNPQVNDYNPGQQPYQPSPTSPTISPPNPYTIKKPLGVFGGNVTPYPVAPKPGQTHNDVFPQNEDKLAGPGYPQTAGPQPHPVPSPNQIPGVSPSGPTSPYGPGITSSGQPGTPGCCGGSPSSQRPDIIFPGQNSAQPSPQTGPGPAGLPGTYRPPLPSSPQGPGSPQGPYGPQGSPQGPYGPQSNPQGPYGPQGPAEGPTGPSGPSGPTGYPQSPQGYGQPAPFPQSGPATGTPIIPGQECGVRRPAPPTKPDETGFGEFPWHAIIQSANNRSSICSAVIIAPNAVLTAAHCIQGIRPEDLTVKAGEWTLQQPGPKPAQSRVAGATAIHPVYNSGSLVKDQAIVVTDQPFQFDQHVDKVCLPQSGSGDYVPKTGTCYITGFGRPSLQNNAPGSIMHKIPITIVPREQCENNLKQTHLGKYFKLNEGFACAAPVSEAELCKVDVGSPLVCDRGDGHYEVAGVYSWDTKCSSALPGVLASPDTDWINQVLATPVDSLRAEQPKPFDHLPEDVEQKPGFALGYGK